MAKYGSKAQKKVTKVMHEFGEGKLKSGGSGKKVTSRKQAVAIGISEARSEGDKVPSRKASSKKSSSTRASSKKTTAKKSPAKKSTASSKKSGAGRKPSSKSAKRK